MIKVTGMPFNVTRKVFLQYNSNPHLLDCQDFFQKLEANETTSNPQQIKATAVRE